MVDSQNGYILWQTALFTKIYLLVIDKPKYVHIFDFYFILQESLADRLSVASKDSDASASETLMSSHAMKMGLYTINLGTKVGQKLHTAHMLILPLIPVFILLAQNTAAFLQFVSDAEEILDVKEQVGNAVDLSILVQR